MATDHQRWMDARLIDRSESSDVRVMFDPDGGSQEADRPAGILAPAHGHPVGRALSLRLEGGWRMLVVLVDDRGRFMAAGPMWCE